MRAGAIDHGQRAGPVRPEPVQFPRVQVSDPGGVQIPHRCHTWMVSRHPVRAGWLGADSVVGTGHGAVGGGAVRAADERG